MFSTQVIHYTPLRDRYIYLSKISELHLNFVTEKSIQNENQIFVHSKKVFGIRPTRYGFNLGINSRAIKTTRRRATLEGFRLLFISFITPMKRHILYGSIPEFIRLPNNQLELIKMHVKALKSGCESNLPWILVLEDDAVISDTTKIDIKAVCKSFRKNETVFINLNSGANMIHTKSDPKPNIFGIYRVRPIAVRCTTSYLINRNTAERLLNLFETHGLQDWLPVDVQMQIAIQRLRGKTYWQDPPMFIQGSEDGTYSSNLR